MMQQIQNYDCDGLCIQKFCSRRYTWFTELRVHGLDVLLGFCEEHAEMYDKNMRD